MANLRTTRSWTVIWDKLQQLVGFRGVESPFASGPTTIDEALTIYVTTTGNDNNPGTVDAPFLTIQAAIDLLKKYVISAPVVIQIGAGTFSGFKVEGLNILDSGSLAIKGTTSIVNSGTITTLVTTDGHVVLTDAAGTYVVNSLTGKILEAVTPTVTGEQYRVAIDNTATTVNIPGAGWAANGTGYRVLSLDTIILSNPTTPYAVIIGDNMGGLNPSNPSVLLPAGYKLSLETLDIQASTVGTEFCIRATNANFLLTGCRITRNSAGTSGTLGSVTACSSLLDGCYMENSANTSSTACITFTNPQNCMIKNSFFRKLTNLNGTFMNADSFNVTGVCVEGVAAAISMSISAKPSLISSMWLKSCATGVGVVGASLSISNIETTGNTTGISVTRGGNVSVGSGTLGATTCISVTTGGMCQVASGVTFTAVTAELSVDAVTSTVAAMRALSPKCFPAVPNVYASYIYE